MSDEEDGNSEPAEEHGDLPVIERGSRLADLLITLRDRVRAGRPPASGWATAEEVRAGEEAVFDHGERRAAPAPTSGTAILQGEGEPILVAPVEGSLTLDLDAMKRINEDCIGATREYAARLIESEASRIEEAARSDPRTARKMLEGLAEKLRGSKVTIRPSPSQPAANYGFAAFPLDNDDDDLDMSLQFI